MSSSSLLPKQLLQLAAAQRSGGFAFIHLAFLLSVGGGSCSFDKKLRIGLPRESEGGRIRFHSTFRQTRPNLVLSWEL